MSFSYVSYCLHLIQYLRSQINELAWEASKAQLVSCGNCGRKFAPDRLPVHLKSCKPKSAEQKNSSFADKSNEVLN